MKLFELAKNFRNDESGAVTVDWVVLTAAVVALAIGVLAGVTTATDDLATEIKDAVEGVDIDTGDNS